MAGIGRRCLHTKHEPVRPGSINSRLQPDVSVDDSVEVDVVLEHIPDITSVLDFPFLLQMRIVRYAAFDPAGQERQGAAAVSDQNIELRKTIPDATQEHTSNGNGGLEWKAKCEWKDVPVITGPRTVD